VCCLLFVVYIGVCVMCGFVCLLLLVVCCGCVVCGFVVVVVLCCGLFVLLLAKFARFLRKSILFLNECGYWHRNGIPILSESGIHSEMEFHF
jgi:hypothetical protein